MRAGLSIVTDTEGADASAGSDRCERDIDAATGVRGQSRWTIIGLSVVSRDLNRTQVHGRIAGVGERHGLRHTGSLHYLSGKSQAAGAQGRNRSQADAAEIDDMG